jgi:Domain of unknown function (DUF4185)
MVLAGIAGIAILGLPVACDGGGGNSAGHKPVAGPPEFSVVGIKHLPPIVNDVDVKMWDCGYSTTFQGKSVWVFGDTFLSLYNEEGKNMLCNSMAATLDQDAGDGIAAMSSMRDDTGAPDQLIPLTDEEKEFNLLHQGKDCAEPPCGARWAIWPGAIITHPSSESAYVFYHKVYIEPGFLNFLELGHSIAVWGNVGKPAVRPLVDVDPSDPTIMFPTTDRDQRHAFGSAALMMEDWLYVYGCEYETALGSSPCRLAKVHFDHVLDRSQWQFFAGEQGWVSNVELAEPVFDGCAIASVFYNAYLKQYIAVYAEPTTNKVMLRSANQPEGPWTQPRTLFTADSNFSNSLWTYDALAHPEFSEGNGKQIYITYTRKVKPFQSELSLVMVEFQTE